MIISDPVRQELIDMLVRITRSRKAPRQARMQAAFFLLSRTDPVPSAPPMVLQTTGPTMIQWKDDSLPSSLLALPSGASSTSSNGSTSSSATEDSANRTWL